MNTQAQNTTDKKQSLKAMSLIEVVKELGITGFNMNYAVDQETKVKTQWLRQWDNENRISISMHENTMKSLLADKSLKAQKIFGIQHETRHSKETGEQYESYRIVKFDSTEFNLSVLE